MVPRTLQVPIVHGSATIVANPTVSSGQRLTNNINANATITSGALNEGGSRAFNVHSDGLNDSSVNGGSQRSNATAANA